MKLISKGAEASIYLDSKKIVKIRREKKYRIKDLDRKLRKARSSREIKILEKLKDSEISVPRLLGSDVGKSEIHLEFIEGKKLKDVLARQNCVLLGSIMGRSIALLHSRRIIHGDLTTSNLILQKDKIFLIDFGLSFFSHKPEDKAVDLHLLKQALKSSHNDCFEECFDAVIESYQNASENPSEVLKRLRKVESRGRYKGKK